jgi:Iodothyronine deiodinase
MLKRKWLLIGVVGFLPFLAPASNAQEPVDKGQKPPTLVKDIPRLFDPKSLEDPAAVKAAIVLLESAYEGQRQPEAVRMLIAILRGSQMGPNDGWFGPTQTRYRWKWLADRSESSKAKGIPRDKFTGSDAWFARLDRNRDGVISPNDLDWSDGNPDVQMMLMANRIFRRLNAGGNGRLSKDDLLKFFEQAAKGKEFLSPDDFREAMIGGSSGGFLPGDAPTRAILIRGLFAGELGSMQEGPQLEQLAPDFTLRTVDGKGKVQFSKLIGSKPVVLVLGNFTCGPFRSIYAGIEDLYQRYKKDATFLTVYVREAHPTDGWKMESNARVGVAVKQPTTFAERTAIAGQFCQRLKASMPVVVDEIDDPVGHAYSGMPGRMYIIDSEGKVAYKSGRGPYGFRVGELEQALVMALLEHMPAEKQ